MYGIPVLSLSLLFLLKSPHLVLQAPEGENGEGPKEEDATDGRVEDGRLDECEAMTGPVVEVGGGVHLADPDHQPDQGGRVEDPPGD